MQIRRVVTGQTAEGKSVVVSDEKVDGITVSLLPGSEFHRLGGSDRTTELSTDGSPPPAPFYFPPASGFRFGLFTIGPHEVSLPEGVDIDTVVAEFQEKLPGLIEVMEVDNPGMHTTDTVDFDYIVSGEVWLELDDGQQVHLHAGDCVMQNGTRHAWRNRSSSLVLWQLPSWERCARASGARRKSITVERDAVTDRPSRVRLKGSPSRTSHRIARVMHSMAQTKSAPRSYGWLLNCAHSGRWSEVVAVRQEHAR
jgi:mannose-6-phosphate isomerase-like protein (cupin superfamily)